MQTTTEHSVWLNKLLLNLGLIRTMAVLIFIKFRDP